MPTGSGSGGGSAGGKYVLTFTLEGTGEQKLEGVVTALKQIAAQTGNGGASAAIDKAAEAIAHLGTEAAAAAVKTVALDAKLNLIKGSLNEAASWGRGAMNFGGNILKTFGGIAQQVLTTNGAMEDSILQLKVIGDMSNDQAKAVINNVNDLVAQTPYMSQDLLDLSKALAVGKVSLNDWTDAAGKVRTLGDEAAHGFSSMDAATRKAAGGVHVNALSVMADFASMTGNVGPRFQTFVSGIQRALATNSAVLLRDQVNVEALKAITGGGIQIQGKAEDVLKRMYAYLQKKHAVGMGAMMSGTATGVMSNIKELPIMLMKALGGDVTDANSPFGKLKGAYLGLFGEISAIASNQKWQQSIAKITGPLIEKAAWVMEKLSHALAGVMRWFGEHPKITAFALGVTALVAGIALLTGALTVFVVKLALAAIAVYAFKFAMKGAWAATVEWTAAMWASLVPMLPWIALGAAIALAMYGIYKAVEHLIEVNPSLQKFFGNIKLFATAAWEALSNWSGSTTKISKHTAEELDKAGLLNPFLKLMTVFRGVEKVLKEVWATMKPVINEMLDMFENMFGISTKKSDEFGDSIKSGRDDFSDLTDMAMRGFILMIGAAGKMVTAVAYLNLLFVGLSASVNTVMLVIMGFFEALGNTVTNMINLVGALATAFERIAHLDFSGAKAALVDWKDKLVAGIGDPAKNVSAGVAAEAARVDKADQLVEQAKRWGDVKPVTEHTGTLPTLENTRTRGTPMDRNAGLTPDQIAMGKRFVELPQMSINAHHMQTMPPQIIQVILDGKVLAQSIAKSSDRMNELKFPARI